MTWTTTDITPTGNVHPATIPGCIFLVRADHVNGPVVAAYENVEAAHDAYPDRAKHTIQVLRIADSDLYVPPR